MQLTLTQRKAIDHYYSENGILSLTRLRNNLLVSFVCPLGGLFKPFEPHCRLHFPTGNVQITMSLRDTTTDEMANFRESRAQVKNNIFIFSLPQRECLVV